MKVVPRSRRTRWLQRVPMDIYEAYRRLLAVGEAVWVDAEAPGLHPGACASAVTSDTQGVHEDISGWRPGTDHVVAWHPRMKAVLEQEWPSVTSVYDMSVGDEIVLPANISCVVCPTPELVRCASELHRGVKVALPEDLGCSEDACFLYMHEASFDDLVAVLAKKPRVLHCAGDAIACAGARPLDRGRVFLELLHAKSVLERPDEPKPLAISRLPWDAQGRGNVLYVGFSLLTPRLLDGFRTGRMRVGSALEKVHKRVWNGGNGASELLRALVHNTHDVRQLLDARTATAGHGGCARIGPRCVVVECGGNLLVDIDHDAARRLQLLHNVQVSVGTRCTATFLARDDAYPGVALVNLFVLGHAYETLVSEETLTARRLPTPAQVASGLPAETVQMYVDGHVDRETIQAAISKAERSATIVGPNAVQSLMAACSAPAQDLPVP